MNRGIFITGTGTDVGKTYIAGLILKKLRESGVNAGYFKAAMSGNEPGPDGKLIPGDALHVKTVSGTDQSLEEMCPYVYRTAVSPHLASRLEGGPVDLDVIRESFERVQQRFGFVLAEGSGGIVCPIRYGDRRIFLEDIINTLGLPCVIAADAGLGTINSVVLTYEYMKARSIPVKGIIFNNWTPGDVMQEDNRLMCQELTGLPVLACVSKGSDDINITAEELTALCR